MAKPSLRHLRDSEGFVHYEGSFVCVNVALCGSNDDTEETYDAVDCKACIAQLRHVYNHRREEL